VRVALLVLLLAACDADSALHRMQVREVKPAMQAPAGVIELGSDEAPVVVTRELLARGEDRFDRTCAQCHGVLGDGDSDVARAMVGRKPGSLLDARITGTRVMTAIEVGYGAMPALADVLPPRDRVAVMHFVRALQLRDVALAELPPDQLAAARGGAR
jgi:mono/diheme cytochrome c family protein